MIIDSHVHVFSNADISPLLNSMKNNNIIKACVMYWPFGKTDDPNEKIWSLSEMSKALEPYSNLYLIGSMKITDKKNFSKNLKEIESLLKAKKLVALKFYLGYEHYFANDKRAEKLFDLCIKYDVPAYFHTGDNWITPKTKDAIVRYASPLYIGDVAVKYPNLKIIIAHLGDPWTMEAAMIISNNDNVYGDIAALLSYDISNSILARVDNEHAVRKVTELIAWCRSSRKLIFGSDFPIFPQKNHLDFLNSFPHISKEDKEYILYKNAQMLFKI